MKTTIKISIFLVSVSCLAASAQKKPEYVIESRLFQGSRSEPASGPAVVISSNPRSFYSPLADIRQQTEDQVVTNLATELNSIYQLNSVEHLASSQHLWDGETQILTSTVVLDGVICPINLTPRLVSKDNVSLRVEIFKSKDEAEPSSNVRTEDIPVEMKDVFSTKEQIPVDNKDMEKLLDTELILKINEPVVFGFPSDGKTYFLSVDFKKGRPSTFLGSQLAPPLKEISFLAPPKPVHQVLPSYPERLKQQKIEGKVILEVTTEKDGKVIKVQVLQPVHPELDKAARDALLEWRYEPVFKDGKPVSVTFNVIVEFKARDNPRQSGNGAVNEDEGPLANILKGCAEYCDLLARASLFFVCEERIQEEIYDYSSSGAQGVVVVAGEDGILRTYSTVSRPRKVEKNAYIYDYQLIQKRGRVEESRALLSENNQPRQEKNAPLKTKRFYSERSVLGPVGLLGRECHSLYDYKLVKEDKIKGRKAFVLEIKPKTKMKDRPNYGKAWVDCKDYSILKIETDMESLAGFGALQPEEDKKSSLKPAFTIIHEYEFEKNGLRFPSRTFFKEEYSGLRVRRYTRSKLEITYDKYRFFTVETDVKY